MISAVSKFPLGSCSAHGKVSLRCGNSASFLSDGVVQSHSKPMLVRASFKFKESEPTVLTITGSKTEHSRRAAIFKFVQSFIAVSSVNLYNQDAANAEPSTEPSRYLRTPSGIKYEDVYEGNGDVVKSDDLVEINYVCRRSNGYFVYSTVDPLNGNTDPIFLKLGENKVIQGLEDLLVGMHVGGKRRAIVPPSLGYVNRSLEPQPKEFGPLRSLFAHANEPLFFEIQVLKVKRL